MAGVYIENRALFGRFFPHQVFHQIPNGGQPQEFEVRTQDPNYRGIWRAGVISFVIYSTAQTTELQILRDNTHIVADRKERIQPLFGSSAKLIHQS